MDTDNQNDVMNPQTDGSQPVEEKKEEGQMPEGMEVPVSEEPTA